jgi:serine/arginine repetitive matrix protein 2
MHQSSQRESSPEGHSTWTSKLRSKSASRSRATSSKRSSFDVIMGKARDEDEPTSPGEDIIPAFSDFASVARSLGSGSYDISTNQFAKRATAPAPGSTLHQLQSPYLISTGLKLAKSTKGMSSEAAIELARMKSRDFAKQDMVPQNDRPRMAIPKRGKSSAPTTPTRRVEDRFPEWQSKAVSNEASVQRPPRVSSLYAESIPPLPELPADVAAKASKADEMVAKKLKDSTSSTRSSQEALQREQKAVPQPLPAASSEAEVIDDAEKGSLGLLHPAERATAKQSAAINIQVRELNGSSSENSSFVEMPETQSTPKHESLHSGWSGWEEQSRVWKQHRESLKQTLGQADDEISVITAESPPVSRKPSDAIQLQREPSKSPSIVVSRYITPLGAENAARANMQTRMTDAAQQRANIYRDLIAEDKENRPAKTEYPPRTDSAVTTTSTSTFVTVKSWAPRPPKMDIIRTNTASSMTTVTTTTSSSTIRRERSPGGRVQTPSGRFTPYSPAQAGIAERSRANSLAKLAGGANLSATSLEGPSNRSSESLVDRYSGGLGFGWEKGKGFNTSAGTRSSGSEVHARRKSVKLSEELGIDLSDVPVFLQKVPQ